jgi:hypothetical protein
MDEDVRQVTTDRRTPGGTDAARRRLLGGRSTRTVDVSITSVYPRAITAPDSGQPVRRLPVGAEVPAGAGAVGAVG